MKPAIEIANTVLEEFTDIGTCRESAEEIKVLAEAVIQAEVIIRATNGEDIVGNEFILAEEWLSKHGEKNETNHY